MNDVTESMASPQEQCLFDKIFARTRSCWQAAIHEAGHIVLYLEHGLDFSHVWVEGRRGAVVLGEPEVEVEDDAAAMIIIAGSEAQSRVCEASFRTLFESETQLNEEVEGDRDQLARILGVSEPENLDNYEPALSRYREATAKILDARWEQVERLAVTLANQEADRKVLTYQQCLALVTPGGVQQSERNTPPLST